MSGTFELAPKEHGFSVLIGKAPVSEIQNYPKEVAAYTKGFGRIFLTPAGYAPCHNAEEVIALPSDMMRSMTRPILPVLYSVPTEQVFMFHGTK